MNFRLVAVKSDVEYNGGCEHVFFKRDIWDDCSTQFKLAQMKQKNLPPFKRTVTLHQ